MTTGQIVMEDVEIPEENLLPEVSGLKVCNTSVRVFKDCTHVVWFCHHSRGHLVV